MGTYLLIGGLVAAGFDATEEFLLTISHSGRGVFSTKSWQLVARDYELAYPEAGAGLGIGPIVGQKIRVAEMDFATGQMRLVNEDGRIVLNCQSDGITVEAP